MPQRGHQEMSVRLIESVQTCIKASTSFTVALHVWRIWLWEDSVYMFLYSHRNWNIARFKVSNIFPELAADYWGVKKWCFGVGVNPKESPFEAETQLSASFSKFCCFRSNIKTDSDGLSCFCQNKPSSLKQTIHFLNSTKCFAVSRVTKTSSTQKG